MACYRENDCVGCETCMNCGRNRNYYIWECDECGYTSEDKTEFRCVGGKDYCTDCYKELMDDIGSGR